MRPVRSVMRKGTARGRAESQSGAASGTGDLQAGDAGDRVPGVLRGASSVRAHYGGRPACGGSAGFRSLSDGVRSAAENGLQGPAATDLRLLEDWFLVRMSLGRVSASVQEPAEALVELAEEIGQGVRSASVVHADETSWRVEKKRAWLWGAATERVTYYLIRRSRSQAVAKQLWGH